VGNEEYLVCATGNTNIIYRGGNVLALDERGLLCALDPDTLETRGPDPYGGQVAMMTFAAVPESIPARMSWLLVAILPRA
jgi:carotenoid cleavage dioxygenase